MSEPLWLPLWAFVAIGAFCAILLVLAIFGLLRGRGSAYAEAGDKKARGKRRTSERIRTERPEALEAAGNWRIANVQGQGARGYQEDAFGVSPMVQSALEAKGFAMVLADGMGGMDGGAIIARTVVERLLDEFAGMSAPLPMGEMEEKVRALSRHVFDAYGGQGGCTLVLAHVWQNALSFINVGDSDLFLLRENRLHRLTRRHEYQNDLWLSVFRGELSEEDAKNDPQGQALSSYIGMHNIELDSTKRPFPLQKTDCLMLCSDGVSDTLSHAQLGGMLAAGPEAAASQIEAAIETAASAHQDNFTAIIARLG